jgi:hypothetical protein
MGKVIFHEATINLASVDAASVDATNDVTIGGAAIGDVVVVNWTNEATALSISAYVSAANVVTVVAANASAGAINADSATFYFMVFKRK